MVISGGMFSASGQPKVSKKRKRYARYAEQQKVKREKEIASGKRIDRGPVKPMRHYYEGVEVSPLEHERLVESHKAGELIPKENATPKERMLQEEEAKQRVNIQLEKQAMETKAKQQLLAEDKARREKSIQAATGAADFGIPNITPVQEVPKEEIGAEPMMQEAETSNMPIVVQNAFNILDEMAEERKPADWNELPWWFQTILLTAVGGAAGMAFSAAGGAAGFGQAFLGREAAALGTAAIKAPATAKQLATLKKLRIKVPKGASVSEASALLTKNGVMLKNNPARRVALITKGRKDWIKTLKMAKWPAVVGVGYLVKDTMEAQTILTSSNSELGSIRSDVEKGLITSREEAEMLTEEVLQNIYSAEAGIQYIMQNSVLKTVSFGYDTQTKFENWRRRVEPHVWEDLDNAFLSYQASVLEGNTPEQKLAAVEEEAAIAQYGS